MKQALQQGLDAKHEAIHHLNEVVHFLQDLVEELREGNPGIEEFLLNEQLEFEKEMASQEVEFNALVESADKLHLAARSSKEGDSSTSLFTEINTDSEALSASPAPPPQTEVRD